MRSRLPLWFSFAFALLFLGVAKSLAQRDFRYYDQTTYAFYQDSSWQELARVGRQALREGFDYYYLRMRLGLAKMRTAHFQGAIPHFRRALAHNPSSTLAREYLVYALGQSGRRAQARAYFDSDTGSPEMAVAVSPLAVSGVFAYKLSDQKTDVGDMWYASAAFQHGLGGRLSLNHRYSRLSQLFSDSVQVEKPSPPGPGGDREDWEEVKYTIRQSEYQFAGVLVLGTSLQAEGGANYLWGEGEEYTFSEWACRAGLTTFFPGLRLTGRAGYASFAGQPLVQFMAQAYWYPRQNTNLFFSFSSTLKTQEDEWQGWHGGSLGGRILPDTWLEVSGEFGRINYFQDWNQDASYNIADLLQWRAGAHLQYWLGGYHRVYLAFLVEAKERALSGGAFRHQSIIVGLQLNLKAL